MKSAQSSVTVQRRRDIAQVFWTLRSLQRQRLSRNALFVQLDRIKRSAPAGFQFVRIRLAEAECPETEQRFHAVVNKLKLYAMEREEAASSACAAKHVPASRRQ